MTLSPCPKTKFTPSSTSHASLSHISNNAETACHRVPHVPTTAPEPPASRASSSPRVPMYFKDNIYKPWALGFNTQHSGNGTYASTGAADLLQRAVFIVKMHHLKGMGWDRSREKKPKLQRDRTCCLAACPQALLAHIACTI